MCHKSMFLILTILLLANVGRMQSAELKPSLCERISNYKCNETLDFIHLYRPDVDANVQFRTNFFSFDIECETPAMFDFRKFPRLNLNLNETFVSFTNCSIPEEDSLGSILEHFGIKDLMGFIADKMGHSVQHLFSSGCENLLNLDISSNGLTHLNENALDTLIMLTVLNLQSNNISVLHRNVFKNLYNLDWLLLDDNQLESLEEGIFAHQNKLRSLSLRNNKLKYLTKEMFAGLSALNHLDLAENNFERLTSDAFYNLPLISIYFGNKNIKYKIPKNIFETNYNLTYLYLERVTIRNGFLLNFTALETIQIQFCEFEEYSGSNRSNATNLSILSSHGRPVHSPSVYLFANQRCTKDLDLSRNEITDLHDGLFDTLTELDRLNLSRNNLTTISGFIFRELRKLYSIRLDNNHLKTISSSAFMNNKQLEVLDLSQNQLVFSGNKTPFSFIDELKELSLKYNNLTAIPSGLKNKKKAFMLDLSSNNITSFKYGELRDTIIHYTPRDNNNEKRNIFKLNEVQLNNNPLKCDCSIYEILMWKENSHDSLRNHMLAICADIPNSHWCFKSEDVSMKCPDQCLCTERYNYETNGINLLPRIIDCDDRVLTTVPTIEHLKSHSLELYISHNSLEELPNLQHNLYVIVIQASHNKIQNIKLENLPPNLRALDVSHNNIKRISANVFDAINNLKTLEIMFLSENPFECDCSTDTEKLIEFVKENISITDLQDVETKCQVSGVVYELSSEVLQDICSANGIFLHKTPWMKLLTELKVFKSSFENFVKRIY